MERRLKRFATFGLVSTALALVLASPHARAEERPSSERAEERRESAREGGRPSRFWWYTPRETAEDRFLSGEETFRPYVRRRRAQGLLWVPRVVLFLPETVVLAASEPFRLLLVLEDRYKVAERAQRFFFNDAMTFGIYPTAFYETGLGPSVGLRMIHRDLFGAGEHLTLHGGFGGIQRQLYALGIDTGRRFRRIHLDAFTTYGVTNRRRFYGIGNADAVAPEDVTGLLDAQNPGVAVRTHYVVNEVAGWLGGNAMLRRHLRVLLHERIRRRWFSVGDAPHDPPWLTDVFAAQTVTGFEDQSDAYTELRAQVGNTRSIGLLAPRFLPTHGARLDLWGGYQQGLANPFRFGRAGFDAQKWIHLFGGDRVLRLRLRAASVIGQDARIPLLDYPSLGGWLLLRGYPRERFRDRIAALTTAEYRFPLVYHTTAYVFVDAGRVYHAPADLTFSGLRLGYGGGLQLLTRSVFLAAVQVASSIDGGVYAYVNVTTTDALGPID